MLIAELRTTSMASIIELYPQYCHETGCLKHPTKTLYGVSFFPRGKTIVTRIPLCHEHANDFKIAETEIEEGQL